MALYVLQPGIQPIGQFDFLDTDLSSVQGGMLGTLDRSASRLNSSTEKAAADALDGYVFEDSLAAPGRAVLRLADTSTETNKLFYLLDDGTTGYGTLFGSVIGYPTGLSTSGSSLGPSSAAASGKVTAWDKPGLFAVSTDVLGADVINEVDASHLDTPLPGELLYRGATSAKLVRATASGDKVAQFVELSASRSMVTTPASLVGASETFDRAVVQYLGASFNA